MCSLYRRICYIEVRYIEVLFHTFYCNFGRDIEYRSLYRGLRYSRGLLNRGFTVPRLPAGKSKTTFLLILLRKNLFELCH